MGKSSDAPDPPDYERLIAQQSRVNRINQLTPFGSLKFSGPNRSTATLELNPELQAQLEARRQLSGQQLGEALARSEIYAPGVFDPSLPTVGGGMADQGIAGFDQSTQAQQAAFQSVSGLLEPQFARREEQLRQTLANQGLPIGGEAYEDAFERLNRTENQALTQAALQSVQLGNQRQGQLFGQGLARLGAQQGIRQQNLAEIAALAGQTNAPSLSSFFGPAQVDVAGPAGMGYQGELAGFQADQQQQAATMGGMAALGSAAIMGAFLCSREFKTNKRPVESILPRIEALAVEAWDYKPAFGGETHIGPYAEDFQRLFGVGDGTTINLIDAVGVCLLGIQELYAAVKDMREVDDGK